MALGRSRRSFSASSDNSQTQLMLDLGPRFCFLLADLFEGVAYFLSFGGRQRVVGVLGSKRSVKDGHRAARTIHLPRWWLTCKRDNAGTLTDSLHLSPAACGH